MAQIGGARHPRGKLRRSLGLWFWLVPALALTDIQKMTPQMKNLFGFLSLFLYLSAFQIYKNYLFTNNNFRSDEK